MQPFTNARLGTPDDTEAAREASRLRAFSAELVTTAQKQCFGNDPVAEAHRRVDPWLYPDLVSGISGASS